MELFFSACTYRNINCIWWNLSLVDSLLLNTTVHRCQSEN